MRRGANVILEGMKQGNDDLALEQRIEAHGVKELESDHSPPEVIERHKNTSSYAMTVMGVKRYWQKYHPEKVISHQ